MATLTKSMNLVMGAAPNYGGGTLNGFLFAGSGVFSDFNLLIRGEGVNDSYYPYSRSLNLFIKRPESYDFPLFLRGPGVSSSGSLNLVMTGTNVKTGDLNLAMPKTSEVVSGNLDLYMFGF